MNKAIIVKEKIMYRAYNVKIKDLYKINHNEWRQNCFELKYNKLKKDFLHSFQNMISYIQADKKYTGEDNYNEQKQFDIFIAHSNEDIRLAKSLACIIEEKFGLRCFLDSMYWSNLEYLQTQMLINTKSQEDDILEYNKFLQIAKHCDILMAGALSNMIDKCECVFFLNTPNLSGGNLSDYMSKQYSPWIFYEIYCTSLIKKCVPERYKKSTAMKETHKDMYIDDNLNIKNLTQINEEDIVRWLSSINKKENPLDTLYCQNAILAR